MSRLSYLVSSILALTASSVAAQPMELHTAQPEERHQGLFLRITPGVAGGAATSDTGGDELTLKGGAGRLGIAVGWAVSPRLILAAELLGHAVLGPEIESSGTTTETDDDVVWGISYAGAGLNYYLPSNLYFAASAGALLMSLETSDMKMAETELGFALKLGVGREWWIAPKIGLGVGLEILAGAVSDGEADWTVATVGVAFSATYN
ncbi:MAG: porin family protein [Myxococcota bacterium]|nr:porin family protein [Myxococcota bacterium]